MENVDATADGLGGLLDSGAPARAALLQQPVATRTRPSSGVRTLGRIGLQCRWSPALSRRTKLAQNHRIPVKTPHSAPSTVMPKGGVDQPSARRGGAGYETRTYRDKVVLDGDACGVRSRCGSRTRRLSRPARSGYRAAPAVADPPEPQLAPHLMHRWSIRQIRRTDAQLVGHVALRFREPHAPGHLHAVPHSPAARIPPMPAALACVALIPSGSPAPTYKPSTFRMSTQALARETASTGARTAMGTPPTPIPTFMWTGMVDSDTACTASACGRGSRAATSSS